METIERLVSVLSVSGIAKLEYAELAMTGWDEATAEAVFCFVFVIVVLSISLSLLFGAAETENCGGCGGGVETAHNPRARRRTICTITATRIALIFSRMSGAFSAA